MYIRKKRNGGSSYYQVVESSRVEGKPRQRVILHLGAYSTLKKARTGLKRELSKARSEIMEMQRFSNSRGTRSGGKEAARVEKRIAKLSEKLSKVEKLLKASSCSA